MLVVITTERKGRGEVCCERRGVKNTNTTVTGVRWYILWSPWKLKGEKGVRGLVSEPIIKTREEVVWKVDRERQVKVTENWEMFRKGSSVR